MHVLAIASRLTLAAMFMIAGVAKLLDPERGRPTLLNFGVPAPWAGPASSALPLAELAVAVALLPVASAPIGAAGGLLLLLLFTAGIAYNLALGRKPECNCFGQIKPTPIGWDTLLRNVCLSGLAVVVLMRGGDPEDSLFAWALTGTTMEHAIFTVGLLGLAGVSASGFLLLQLIRQQGRLLVRLEAIESGVGGKQTAPVPEAPASRRLGLPVGSRAPDFELKALDGRLVSLADLTSRAKPVFLIFTNPRCGPCLTLAPELKSWEADHGEALTFALISEGSIEENVAKTNGGLVLVQDQREVAESFQAWGTPGGVLITATGLIDSALAQGADSIRAILKDGVDRHTRRVAEIY